MKTRAAALLVSLSVLAGCAHRVHKDTIVSASMTAPPAAVNNNLAPVSFPNPGPFKTVEVKNPDGSILEALQARGEVGKPGGTLKVATFGSGLKTFNCWDAGDVESKGIGLLEFETLVAPDPWTGEYYPRLAKSYTISPDKKSYTFTLRKGLKWSDGKPLTADDVVFTFNTIVKNGFGQDAVSERETMMAYNQFPKIEKLDDLTIRFTTKVPFAPLLAALVYSIAPKHIFEPITKQPHDKFASFWDINVDPSKIVGSGPFILSRYVPGQRAEFKRNPNYFAVDKEGHRLPYLDGFIVAIVPEQNTEILKFYANELDFLDIRSVRGNDVALMKQRQAQPVYNFDMFNLGPDDGTYFLTFNLNRRKDPKTGKPYVNPIHSEWFNNDYFRQAVSHALNRDRMVANTLKGVGAPLYTPFSSSCLYFDPSLKGYPQDLEFSRELLKKGGFVLKDEKLYDSKGNPVEFSLITNAGNAIRDAICVTIQDELKKLGMKVNYQPIDWNILLDKTSTSLDWEAVFMALSGSRLEPYEGANVWKSSGRLHLFDTRLPDAHGDVKVTDARDWEKQIDDLYDKVATTMVTDDRRQIMNEFQKIAFEKVPFIYVYSPLSITAMRRTVGNYKPMPLGCQYTPKGSLHNIEEIYFKTQGHQ